MLSNSQVQLYRHAMPHVQEIQPNLAAMALICLAFIAQVVQVHLNVTFYFKLLDISKDFFTEPLIDIFSSKMLFYFIFNSDCIFCQLDHRLFDLVDFLSTKKMFVEKKKNLIDKYLLTFFREFFAEIFKI